jgi:hypothetical protein
LRQLQDEIAQKKRDNAELERSLKLQKQQFERSLQQTLFNEN